MNNSVEVKQDFKMEPIIGYPCGGGGGGGREEDYEREITWFSGGNRGGISRRRQSMKGGGGYRKSTTSQLPMIGGWVWYESYRVLVGRSGEVYGDSKNSPLTPPRP